jgi:hypothetical protein
MALVPALPRRLRPLGPTGDGTMGSVGRRLLAAWHAGVASIDHHWVAAHSIPLPAGNCSAVAVLAR